MKDRQHLLTCESAHPNLCGLKGDPVAAALAVLRGLLKRVHVKRFDIRAYGTRTLTRKVLGSCAQLKQHWKVQPLLHLT